MKKIFTLFTAILFAGSMMAETATLTLSSSVKFGTTSGSTLKDDKENVWTCTGSNIQNAYQSTYSGQQFGTSKTNNVFKFTCTIDGATIESVTALMAAGNTDPTYDISIGSDSKYSGSLSTTPTTYGGTDATGTGTICITIDQNSGGKAVYLGSISVDYTLAPPTTVSSPKFSLTEGAYEGTQSVAITCKTEGATIYYTTDGEDPTSESAVYTEAIAVAKSMTIKAFAAKEGLDDSEIVSATYTILAAPDVILDFTDNTEWGFPTEKTISETSYTAGGYTVKVAGSTGQGFYFDDTNENLLVGKSGAYLVLPNFEEKAIIKIVTLAVDNSSGSVTFNVYQGENAVSTEVTSCKEDHSFDISPKKANVEHKIVVTNSNNARFSKIKIWLGEPTEPTSISNTAVDAKAVKTIVNGQLLITRDGKTFNVLGTQVR